jgi:hypothetical protein
MLRFADEASDASAVLSVSGRLFNLNSEAKVARVKNSSAIVARMTSGDSFS